MVPHDEAICKCEKPLLNTFVLWPQLMSLKNKFFALHLISDCFLRKLSFDTEPKPIPKRFSSPRISDPLEKKFRRRLDERLKLCNPTRRFYQTNYPSGESYERPKLPKATKKVWFNVKCRKPYFSPATVTVTTSGRKKTRGRFRDQFIMKDRLLLIFFYPRTTNIQEFFNLGVNDNWASVWWWCPTSFFWKDLFNLASFSLGREREKA